jgi:hypothetical protein
LLIEGENFEVLGFLYGVEALDRLVRVDSIGLNPVPTVAAPIEEVVEGDDATDDVAAPRVRPNADLLGVDITMRIFTRSPAAGSGGGGTVAPQESGAAEDNSGGGDT